MTYLLVLFVSFIGSTMDVGSSATKVPLMLANSNLNNEAISSFKVSSCDHTQPNQHGDYNSIAYLHACDNRIKSFEL